jgi:Ca2+-binding RTX toxin-like protein
MFAEDLLRPVAAPGRSVLPCDEGKMKLISRRFGAVLVAVVSTAAVTASPAHAATSVTVTAGLNKVDVIASPGQANNITLSMSGGNLVVSDTGDTVTPGTGCSAGPNNMVSCPVPDFFTLNVDAGDLNDTITKNANIHGSLSGGAGNDTLHGGNGNDILDVLDGIDGNDVAVGTGGQDICVADDGDTTVSCEN